MTKLEKLLFIINGALYGILAIFSYAYVDLNLTISQNPAVLKFVNTMQELGYYNRPAATGIYLVLIVLAFLFFILNLWLFYKNRISLKYLKISTVANVIILIFAYPFLSSDIFNYLFDAKIILKYHASPYANRALDFPNDDWIRFMRWIHRYSPYGPLWLGASLIPAALGFGKFALNLLMFKIFIGAFHLINTYLVYKILTKINAKYALFGAAFYGLNPLFLLEGVANAHNDVVVATFLLSSTFFLTSGKKVQSLITIFAGALIKYIQILTLPWYILYSNFKKINLEQFIILNFITMATFTYLYSSMRISVPFVSAGSTQIQFQPWYLFWTIPFIALLPRGAFITVAIAISFGAMLRYLPFLYYGDWSQPGTLVFMQIAIVLFPVIGIVWLSARAYLRK